MRKNLFLVPVFLASLSCGGFWKHAPKEPLPSSIKCPEGTEYYQTYQMRFSKDDPYLLSSEGCAQVGGKANWRYAGPYVSYRSGLGYEAKSQLAFFKNGKRHGDFTQLYPIGLSEAAGRYFEGQACGEWICINEKATLCSCSATESYDKGSYKLEICEDSATGATCPPCGSFDE